MKVRAWLALQSDGSLAQCLNTHCWSQGTRRLRRVFCSIIRHLQNSQGPLPGEYRTKPGSACWSLSPHLISSEVLWLNSEQQQGKKKKKKINQEMAFTREKCRSEPSLYFQSPLEHLLCIPLMVSSSNQYIHVAGLSSHSLTSRQYRTVVLI